MPDNVVGLPKQRKRPRVTYKGFAKAFRRLEVQRLLEPVKPEDLKHYPTLGSPPMEWFTARYDGPGEQFIEVGLHALRDIGIAPELLVFRVLRDLYGPPDNITVAFPAGYVANRRELSKGEGPFLSEWGFLLAGSTEAVYEVRKQPGTQQPHLAVWLPRISSVSTDKQAQLVSEFKFFVRELRKTLDESQVLIDRREVKRESVSIGPINVYGDLLAAGDEQLAVVAGRKAKPKASKVEASDGGSISAAALGTFYMSAAVQYLLALEAYVNVVGELLKKDEFSNPIFNRLTREVDFESRLLSLSVFCRGFERAPFEPDMPLFKRIRDLRTFRNEVLHGAFSHDDHVMRLVTEDHYMFYWWPAADEPSLARPDGSRLSLPLVRTLFTKRHADLVRRCVEEAVDAVIAAMDSDHRAWASAWRTAQAIPAVHTAEGWRPSLRHS